MTLHCYDTSCGHSDYPSARGDYHNFVIILHCKACGESAGSLVKLHYAYACCSSVMRHELAELQAFAYAVFADDKYFVRVVYYVAGKDFIIIFKVYRDDSACYASHSSYLVFVDSECLTVPSNYQQVVISCSEAHLRYFVAVKQRHNTFCAVSVFQVLESETFCDSLSCYEKRIPPVGRVVACDVDYAFILINMKRQQLIDRPSFACLCFRNLIALKRHYAAKIRKEE